MSARAVSEATGKRILNEHLGAAAGAAQCRFVSIKEDTDWQKVEVDEPWLKQEVRTRRFITFM